MKIVLAFTLLVVGISASVVPEPSIEPGTVASRDSRFISGAIEAQVLEGIEEISQAIRDDGLDPFHIEKEHFAYKLPVPVLFNAEALVEDILSTGLSDIVVEHINYSLLWNRLDFVLELPHLHFSTRVAYGDITVFGNRLTVEGDGRVDVRGTVVVGQVRVNVGIISGISISGVTVDFNLGPITSNIKLRIQGNNYSQDINDFIEITVPATLEEFSAEINELIEIILLDAINENIDL